MLDLRAEFSRYRVEFAKCENETREIDANDGYRTRLRVSRTEHETLHEEKYERIFAWCGCCFNQVLRISRSHCNDTYLDQSRPIQP